MKFTAIICEHNPITRGHQYLIEKARELTGNPIICIMSGNFVQRGEPSILDKYTRADLSILAGADIVIELPTIYALSSAPDFAYGAIKTLNTIPNIEYLCFGSECGNLEELLKISALQTQENHQNNSNIKSLLKDGTSFASSIIKEYPLLSEPNNMLGVQYLNALSKTNSQIKPITIKRETNYNSKDPSQSAMGLRKLMYGSKFEEAITISPLLNNIDSSKIVLPTSINDLMLYNIRQQSLDCLHQINGISEGLEFKIKSEFDNNDTAEALNNTKSKRYPISKIKRICLNSLLGITTEIVNKAKQSSTYDYVKILAVDNSNKNLLSHLSCNNLLTTKKDYEKLSDEAKRIVNIDILATKIYSCLNKNYSPNADYTTSISIKKEKKD